MQEEIGLCVQSIVAGIISNMQECDDSWIVLAANHLGKSEHVIQGYLKHGNDSLLLANLIHITWQIFHSSSSGDNLSGDMANTSSYNLPALLNFNI
jgi:hypothetical protein